MTDWIRKRWRWLLLDAAIATLAIYVAVQILQPEITFNPRNPFARPADLAALRATAPDTPQAWQSTLKHSITAAADYLVTYQLSNGELPYQVHLHSGDRAADVSLVRQVAGAGTLYNVCRVTQDEVYCDAGEAALVRYLDNVVQASGGRGACFYSRGLCTLGGNALAIDAIYKRWLATGTTQLGDADLLDVALPLGETMVAMRYSDGSLIHGFDPHPGGKANEGYVVPFFPGESLMALLSLYEMTGDPYWLDQARQTNAHMLQQEVTEDHWHAYSFRLFALLDEMTDEDLRYAEQIGQAVLDTQDRLHPDASAVGIAARVEALSALSIAFHEEGEAHTWLLPGMEAFSAYVIAHQLPGHDCEWPADLDLARFDGGIYGSCDDPTIRVDGPLHWINGAALFLEYLDRTHGP